MFVQNAVLHQKLTAENSELWIENSYIGENWTLRGQQIITGVPENNWNLSLPEGVCVDVVPVGKPIGRQGPMVLMTCLKGPCLMCLPCLWGNLS